MVFILEERKFRQLYDSHYQGLVQFALSYLDEPDVAKDIVQDAFVLLWEKREDLENNQDLHHYLVKVVKLKAWNYLEKQRTRISIEEKINQDQVRELTMKLFTLDSISLDEIYLLEMNQIIQSVLKKLPEQTQMIFKLSREQYFSNKQISLKMDLSEKSIEYHLTKALKQLRIALADYLKILLCI